MRKEKSGLRARDKVSYALSTARGVTIQYDLHEYRSIVAAIRAMDLSGAESAALTRKAAEMRRRIAAGANTERELPECFALAAEACRRVLGLAPFDEQLIAGIVMHRGMLAQMQTGEGKTLAAVFPACLNAMAGAGVHILTANDYLARRDARWMEPVYTLLGLTVASIATGTAAADRRQAYLADVTYLTAPEAGFDYLRDGMCQTPGDIVQRGMTMAIVDEADFILIDEARVPLVIAGAADTVDGNVAVVDACARGMRAGVDFTIDREARRIAIQPSGHERVESELGVAGIHEEQGADCFARVYAALHAHHLLKRDIDYVVKDGRIDLVDGFTGRIADRRQWPWGIQPALEAKEGVPIRPEGTVYGSITIQHLMGLYERLAAMTATAVPSAAELFETYGLSTTIIPTVMPVARMDEPDIVFATRAEKMQALVEEITRVHERGRPVLVGTASVLESEDLAGHLSALGVSCAVLNASNDEHEAEVIAAAGRFGALTISTNMAGRGTDIRLAGDQRVIDGGGLYVIGTNRHESKRVDDQLRGRAGRQGEPGGSRFFISLEDPLFERYGVREFLPRDRPLNDPRVLREIDRAQAIIEGRNHAIRRTLAKYARLVEMDRRSVRSLRDEALLHGGLPAAVKEALPGPEARPRAVTAFLCLLDQFWADHLLLVEEVREGIHLERYAGRDPGLEYIHRVGRAFDGGVAAVETTLADACQRSRDDPDALSLNRVGARAPSSTWTYQIDDEAPIGFKLGLVSGSGIGAASLVAAPFIFIGGFGVAVKSAAKALKRIFSAPRARKANGGSSRPRDA
jgi:preprotein translocase subunit SecA